MPKIHVVVGSVEDINRLHANVENKGFTSWIVPKNTRVCDDVLFLLPSFTGPIYAVGNVRTPPTESKNEEDKKGTYRSTIDQIVFLKKPIELDELIEKFSDWDYLTYPRSFNTPKPEQFDEAELRKMIANAK